MIVRREIPHPGAQLRLTDVHGYRYPGCLTHLDTPAIAFLEALYRGRGRCEQAIGDLNATGLTPLPSARLALNQAGLTAVLRAGDLRAGTRGRLRTGALHRATAPRLRYTLLHAAGPPSPAPAPRPPVGGHPLARPQVGPRVTHVQRSSAWGRAGSGSPQHLDGHPPRLLRGPLPAPRPGLLQSLG